MRIPAKWVIVLIAAVSLSLLGYGTSAQSQPYTEEEITFQNGEVTLAGTLTLPEGDGPFPALVLVSGTGPQDRNSSMPGSSIQPFLLLADHLARNGFAVLRYDDCGVGGSSGNWTETSIQDRAMDAAAAVDQLKAHENINPQQIGILGHSEGGYVAAILGSSDPDVAFIVTLAGMVVNTRDLLIRQNELLFRAEGASQEMIDIQLDMLPRAFDAAAAEDQEAFESLVRDAALEQFELLPADQQEPLGDAESYADQVVQNQLSTYFTPWFRSMLAYDPIADWSQVTVPVLAVFGENDIQVDPAQNAPALEAALEAAGNDNFTIMTLPATNHLFQQAETGALSEYSTLPAEFVPDLLPTITNWLQEHVKSSTAVGDSQRLAGAEGMIAYAVRDESFNYPGLRVVNADGTLVREVPLDEAAPENYETRCDAPPKWSPDGTHLAFVRQPTAEFAEQEGIPLDTSELLVFNLETESLQVITDNLYRTFDWSPDGQHIVHDTIIEYDESGDAVDPQGLYIANIETGTDEPFILPVNDDPLWQPDWSGDGAHIGFHAPQFNEGLGIFAIADADGSTSTLWESPTVGNFDWSPDGTQIVFDNVLYLPQASQLAVATITESNTSQDVEVIVEEMTPTQPDWSPDGQTIAFLDTDPDTLRSSLWVVQPDGENPQQVAPEGVSSFSWSPDSTHLVTGTEAGIQIFSLTDDDSQLIAQGGCPDWHPAE